MIMRPLPPRPPLASLLLAIVLASTAVAVTTRAEEAEVKVERVKPDRPKLATLQFLEANRDFVRGELDRLRQKPLARRGDGEALDPRYLEYSKMLAAILADKDSAQVADEAQRRRELLASITELGDLEKQLDLMDRLLQEQQGRLATLEADFTGRQQTALVVVVTGDPGSTPISALALTLEGGSKVTIPLRQDQREALARGGVLQVFHGFVEPREQVVEVTLEGDRWPQGDTGYLTLDPTRDRLTFLKLDLSALRPAQGATSIHARTWLHETKPQKGEG